MKYLLILATIISLILPGTVLAQNSDESNSQTRDVRAEVIKIIEEKEVDGDKQIIFEAKDVENGEIYYIDTADSLLEGLRYRIKKGTGVYLQIVPTMDGGEEAHLLDIDRTKALIWMFIAFAILAIVVGLWRGFFAIIGLTLTIIILVLWVLPQILGGADPVITTVLAAIVILAINMHLSHGFSKSTLLAFSSTVIGLLLAVIFAKVFVYFGNLSGLATEEAAFVYWNGSGNIAPQGVLLAGIIIGASGVLDDIAITQNEAIHEIRDANDQLSKKELFVRAMRLGRHHIASTVNTLVLAYVGVALPVMLLFLASTVGFNQFINTEMIAEEIVRTLAGTAALILTVPIATWLATYSHKPAHKHQTSPQALNIYFFIDSLQLL